jgi:hypothetical protein
VEWRLGGRLIEALLKELEDDLFNYFGMLTEVRNHLKPETRYEKPKALEYYEQIEEFGIPLVAGGVFDQPHIFMMQYRVCQRIKDLFESQWKQNPTG